MAKEKKEKKLHISYNSDLERNPFNQGQGVQEQLSDISTWKYYSRHTLGTPLSKALGYFIVTVLLVVGFLCLFFVDFIYKLLPYTMGCLMIAIGASSVFCAVITKEYKRLDTKLSSTGILLLVIGISIIVHGNRADGLIGVIWGIFGLIEGTESLNIAIYNITHKKKWLADMLQTMLQITLALLLLIDPVTKLYPHMRILGMEHMALAIHIMRLNDA